MLINTTTKIYSQKNKNFMLYIFMVIVEKLFQNYLLFPILSGFTPDATSPPSHKISVPVK